MDVFSVVIPHFIVLDDFVLSCVLDLHEDIDNFSSLMSLHKTEHTLVLKTQTK